MSTPPRKSRPAAADRLFDPAEWPIAWMARAERQHARNATAALAPMGMHHREFRLLAFLGASDGLSVNELAEAAVLERTTVSKMLDRLEAEGWAERRGDALDARRFVVVLTPAGRTKLRAAQGVVQALFQRYGAGTREDEAAEFMSMLKAFYERVRACGAQIDPPKAPTSAPSANPRRRRP